MKNRQNLKITVIMIFIRHLLSMMAVILLATWCVGYIGYGSGGITHLLLVTGLFLILLKAFETRNHAGDTSL